MKSIELKLFMTDTYKVLALVDQKEYQVGSAYASITQKEISSKLGFNIMKTNEIIKNLVTHGYLEKIPNHRGRYKVTKEAHNFIKKIEK